MLAIAIIGLSALGTASLYTAIGGAVVIGVPSAVAGAAGGAVLSQDENASDATNMVNGVIGGAVGAVVVGAPMAVVGGLAGGSIPTKVVLYTAYYGAKATYYVGSLLVQAVTIPAYALVNVVSYEASVTKKDGEDGVLLTLKCDGQSRNLKLDKSQLDALPKDQREALLNGDATAFSAAIPVSTKFMSAKEVKEMYENSIKNNQKVHIIKSDDALCVINTNKDEPNVTKIVEKWNCKSNCEYCDVSFGYIYEGRHHCRNCGKSVCAKDSTHSAYCTATDQLVRVCNHCFEELSKNETENLEILEILVAREEEEEEKAKQALIEKEKREKEEEEKEEEEDNQETETKEKEEKKFLAFFKKLF